MKWPLNENKRAFTKKEIKGGGGLENKYSFIE